MSRSLIGLLSYVLLSLGGILLITQSLLLGVVVMVGVNLLVFLFLKPRWVVPLYVLIAGPSVVIPLGSSGIFSRLYVG
ncbi:MAG TPA: hypothetical protein VKR42_14460, partial [Ktedonobacteraceae bacterium]|nr:hypothetical protein [Ktedonobacteraceae bacterium]